MRAWVLCLLGGVALISCAMGGCAPKSAGGNAAANASASAAPPAPAAAAGAAANASGPDSMFGETNAASGVPKGIEASLPSPKAGLWKRVSVQDGAAPDTSTKCLDGGPINPVEGGPACQNVDVGTTPQGVSFDCSNNDMGAKLHMTFSGDYQSSFTSDAVMNMTGGPGPAMTTHNHSVWTYVGACPAK